MPKMLLLNDRSEEGGPCGDSRYPRGKEVRQVYSEDNDLGYLSTMFLEL